MNIYFVATHEEGRLFIFQNAETALVKIRKGVVTTPTLLKDLNRTSFLQMLPSIKKISQASLKYGQTRNGANSPLKRCVRVIKVSHYLGVVLYRYPYQELRLDSVVNFRHCFLPSTDAVLVMYKVETILEKLIILL